MKEGWVFLANFFRNVANKNAITYIQTRKIRAFGAFFHIVQFPAFVIVWPILSLWYLATLIPYNVTLTRKWESPCCVAVWPRFPPFAVRMEPYRYSNDETTEIESAASSEGGGIQEQGLKNVLHEKGVTKKFNIFFLIHDVWHYFEVYAEKSTIHGIQYLTEPTARKWHKALWVILLLILYITGATFIAQVFSNYSESRISVNIRAVPGLNEVRFPVVTVCNHNKYSRSYWVRQNLSERSEVRSGTICRGLGVPL